MYKMNWGYIFLAVIIYIVIVGCLCSSIRVVPYTKGLSYTNVSENFDVRNATNNFATSMGVEPEPVLRKKVHGFKDLQCCPNAKPQKIEHVFSPKVIIGKGKKLTKKRKIKGGKSKTNKRKIKVQKGGDIDNDTTKYIRDTIEMGLIDQLERVLHMHPEYANYALEKLNHTKMAETTDADIQDMKNIIISIIDKNKNKDN